MRVRAVIGLALIWTISQAAASDDNGGWTLYVAPSGSGENSCRSASSPCATIQQAVDKVPHDGRAASVKLADGVYVETVNIHYYRFVIVTGNCAEPWKVHVEVAQPGGIAFMIQDHAIGAVSCLTIAAATGVSGVIGIQTRQFAIGDYHKIRFGTMNGGVHVVAVERSKNNCLGEIEILGHALIHAQAADGSTVSLSCSMTLAAGLKFDWFVQASWGRATIYLDARAGSLGAITGSPYNVADGTIVGSGRLPTGTAAGVNWNGLVH